MIHALRHGARRAMLTATASVIALTFAVPAHAGGSSMPWEAPLQSILESIEGPVAKIIAVIIIIATGDITISSPAMAITEAALAAMPSILTVTFPSYSFSMV